MSNPGVVTSQSCGTGPPQFTEYEELNLRQSCQSRESEELTSGEELQVHHYSSSFLDNSSNSLVSSSVNTSKLGRLWGSEMLVPRALDIKDLGTDILQPEESFIDASMIQSSTLPLSFHNQPFDKIAYTVETQYFEMPELDGPSKEWTKEKQVGELENSLQGLFQPPQQSWSSPSRPLQAGLGAPRGWFALGT